jgi:hypothetical protein
MTFTAIRRYFDYGRMGDFIISLILVSPILVGTAIACFLLFCMVYGVAHVASYWLIWREAPRCQF